MNPEQLERQRENRQLALEGKRKAQVQIHTQVRLAISCWIKAMTRMDCIRDPMSRSLCFADKLFMLFDGMNAALEMFINVRSDDTDLAGSDEVFAHELQLTHAVLAEMKDKLDSGINRLLEWIQSPAYSPDHPFGASVMQSAGISFEEKSNRPV